MARFFNPKLIEETAHMAIADGKKVLQLPIIRGVVSIPQDLLHLVSLAADWVPFTGQVQDVSEESLKPLKSVDKHYAKE